MISLDEAGAAGPISLTGYNYQCNFTINFHQNFMPNTQHLLPFL